MSARRILSCILLPAYLSSCTAWHVQSASPKQVITEDQPSKIRVTLTDSSTVEMEQPRIVGDTLRGLVKGGADDSLVERDVLLANIATVRVRKSNVGKTVGSALFVVAVVAFLVYKAVALSDSIGVAF